MGFNTDALHKENSREKSFGATLTPIYQVSAFCYENVETLEKVFAGNASGFAYTRIGNPTVAAFEQRIAALEHGFSAVACSSGMAAISQALLNILCSGDELICSSGLYGGTIQLFSILKQFGIKIIYTSDFSSQHLESIFSEKTKAIFAEVISNPSLEIIDVKKLADFAHSKKIPLIVDSTTATPFLINPIDFGADIVIHSSSKYINGSSDSISGVIVDSGKFDWDFKKFCALEKYKKFGTLAYTVRLRKDLVASVGGCLSPFNAYMNLVGLETLGLRMERICNNAKKLALALSKLDGIFVNYPLIDDFADADVTGAGERRLDLGTDADLAGSSRGKVATFGDKAGGLVCTTCTSRGKTDAFCDETDAFADKTASSRDTSAALVSTTAASVSASAASPSATASSSSASVASANPRANLAKNQLKGFGGGILTLRAGSKEKAFKILNSLKIAKIASNIGDVRTLVIYPATTLYIHNTKEEMNAAGVFDDTIRVSVGIEDVEDLIADFTNAIKLSNEK